MATTWVTRQAATAIENRCSTWLFLACRPVRLRLVEEARRAVSKPDAIPGADRTPAVDYVDNPYVGDNFEPVEDEYGNPVYPTPVIVEPGH